MLTTIIACLFFSRSSTFAFVSTDLPQDNPGTISKLINAYCSTLLVFSQPFIANGFVYNAQQSAFVHLLCRNMGQPTSYFGKETSYFSRLTFKQLWFQDIASDGSFSTDLCSPGSMGNDCDLATNVPNLFNGIMNDYVNMKQADLYALSSDSKDDPDWTHQINVFSSNYFDGVEICGTRDPRYPQTCKIMQWYIKNVRNILSNVRILSATGILAVSTLKDKSISCAALEWKDVFYCWLYGDKAASMVSFVNLAYNELFYYRLFMAYYLTMLQQYPELLKWNAWNLNYSSVFKTFSSQYAWSKDALSLSLRMMRDTYVAFPFHIGFLMYQEDLHGFGRDLAHIAPPIYTLYDKLRNVQKP